VAILPELLAKWYSQSIVMPAAAVIEYFTTYNYCYCKEESGGK